MSLHPWQRYQALSLHVVGLYEYRHERTKADEAFLVVPRDAARQPSLREMALALRERYAAAGYGHGHRVGLLKPETFMNEFVDAIVGEGTLHIELGTWGPGQTAFTPKAGATAQRPQMPRPTTTSSAAENLAAVARSMPPENAFGS